MKTKWYLIFCLCALALVTMQSSAINATGTLTGHTWPVTTVGFAPDGTRLVSGDEGGVIKIWNLQTGQALKTIQAHRGRINAVVVSPNGKAIASAGVDNAVKIWSMTTFAAGYSFVPPEPQKSFIDEMLEQMKPSANAVCFSANTRYLTSGHSDFRAFVWNLSDSSYKMLSGTSDMRTAGKAPGAPVISAALSPNAQMAAAGEKQDSYTDVLGKSSTWAYIYVWNPATREVIKRFDAGSSVIYLAFLPDNKHLISALLNGKILVWDAVRGESVKSFDHGGTIRSATLSQNGERLVTCSRDIVKIWDIKTGAVKSHNGPFDADFTAVGLSADGGQFAIGHGDSKITIMDVGQLKTEVLFDEQEQQPAQPEAEQQPQQPQPQPEEKLWD